MTQLLETIRIEGGAARNLSLHAARMTASRRELLGCRDEVDPASLIAGLVLPAREIWKLRVVYAETIVVRELTPYVIRPVRSLRLVRDDAIAYAHKFADRSMLEALRARRAGCDDVLIVRNGLVTDTTYANIALTDGQAWYTPTPPLLAGVQRTRLVADGTLQERRIAVKDLARYRSFVLINAMLGWGATAPVDVAAIVT